MTLKKSLAALILFSFLLGGLESCFLFRGKNKCASCPGISKPKRTRKASKGSI